MSWAIRRTASVTDEEASSMLMKVSCCFSRDGTMESMLPLCLVLWSSKKTSPLSFGKVLPLISLEVCMHSPSLHCLVCTTIFPSPYDCMTDSLDTVRPTTRASSKPSSSLSPTDLPYGLRNRPPKLCWGTTSTSMGALCEKALKSDAPSESSDARSDASCAKRPRIRSATDGALMSPYSARSASANSPARVPSSSSAAALRVRS
mmetsp:Transcript_21813/g.49676  ORF Transcript_21813/g.49676 Transcript_21813/m.49676 type:complete len:204 (+) Transcript_21813:409-1020(+)